jgi:sulfate transport system ATP-binding protein
MSIEARNVTMRYPNGTLAVDNVSFTIEEGEMVGFLGPSGCGKTSLLRVIAGLESVTSGEVYIRGVRVDDLPPQKRGVGFVFQNYALFKHMTVFDNIAFGLRVKKQKSIDIRERVEKLLQLIKLDGFGDRFPDQLSGGQRQRVALARALAPEPSVLLLDEPFSALDAKIRKELRSWVRQIHDEIGVTSIFVTHDQDEALEIADRVLVLQHGRTEQFATPREVYESPASHFVASFVGDMNEFIVTVDSGIIEIGGSHLPIDGVASGTKLNVMVRPSDVRTTPQMHPSSRSAKVVSALYRGDAYIVELEWIGGQRIKSLCSKTQGEMYQTNVDQDHYVDVEILDYKVYPEYMI